MSKRPSDRREVLKVVGAASVAALIGGCGDDQTGGGKGTGGSGTGSGGKGTAGSGGSGAGNGGSSSGGTGSGGTSSGGTSSGGTSSGGTSSGGTSSGGKTGTGGTGTGGTGTGGTGTGGAGGGKGGTGGTATGGAGGTGTGGAGGSSTGGAGGGGPVDCNAKKETTLGPYPNPKPLNRRKITTNSDGSKDRTGAPFILRIRVLDSEKSCAAIPGAFVDIWHCDAAGIYSAYTDGMNPKGNRSDNYLRGYQTTNDQGVAEFETIYPGSYSGRAVHIHFGLHGKESDALPPNADGSSLGTIFVAQLYFQESMSDSVYKDAAFQQFYKDGAAVTPNQQDSIFTGQGGKDLVLKVVKNGNGYSADVDIAVRRKDIGM